MNVTHNDQQKRDLARFTSLNRLCLTSARAVARSHASESRFEIPLQLKPCYVDLNDDDLQAFAVMPFALFTIRGIREQHENTPASKLLEIDCEVIRRTIHFARDLSRSDSGEPAYSKPMALLDITKEDLWHIKNINDDQLEAVCHSSRVALVPRVAPEEKYRTKDGMRWNNEALMRRFKNEIDKTQRMS